MAEADDIVLEALLDDVLDPTIIKDAVDEALGLIVETGLQPNPVSRIEREIAKVEQERARLVTAIATGGALGRPSERAPRARGASSDVAGGAVCGAP